MPSKTISNKENTNPKTKVNFKPKNDFLNSTKMIEQEITSSNEENRRFQRTFSFINTKKKRSSKSCTLNRNADRRLSLNPSKMKNNKENKDRANSLENSFNNSLPSDDEFKAKELIQNRRFSNFNPQSYGRSHKFKSLRSRLKKRNNYEATLELLKQQTLFDIDQRLKDYIQNQNQSDVSMNSSFENEELNNKIDLEIRILDGILKLLNAICSSSSLAPASLNQSNQNSVNQNGINQNSATQQLLGSMLINNLDTKSIDTVNKCSKMGVEIASAFMTTRLPNDTLNKSNTTNGYSPFTTNEKSSTISNVSSTTALSAAVSGQFDSSDSIYQILSACKCLYVSHRKIAIYLQNLQELEKKGFQTVSKSSKRMNISDLVNSSENLKETDKNSTLKKNQFGTSHKPKAPLANLTLNFKNEITGKQSQSINSNNTFKLNSSVELQNTTKLMLKDLRVPLVWKWSDHLKATKNPENVSAKFATFAIIHLGNMIYDTQLISNIDPSITDISFNETFIFDDVKFNDFEITIEIYSYELFNTGNNILQSAKKLAKTLSDFASFKRNGNNNTNQLQQAPSISTLNNQQNSNNSNNYSYSMHKFRLIARAKLGTNDISEEIETKPLQLINESNLDQNHGNISGSSNGNLSIQNQNNSLNNLNSTVNLTNSATNTKLPIFDFYSCCLCYAPTSTYI